jgi:hypothetical protein
MKTFKSIMKTFKNVSFQFFCAVVSYYVVTTLLVDVSVYAGWA